jgi:hypothetical protein
VLGRFARSARESLRSRIFFPISALLVGHEAGFAPSSRLDLEKNLSRNYSTLLSRRTLEAPGAAAIGPGLGLERFEVGFELFLGSAVGEVGGHGVNAGEAFADKNFGEVFHAAGFGFDEDEGMVAIGFHDGLPAGEDDEGMGIEEVEGELLCLGADGDGLGGRDVVEVFGLVANSVGISIGSFGSIDEVEAEGFLAAVGEASLEAIAVVAAAGGERGAREGDEAGVGDGGELARGNGSGTGSAGFFVGEIEPGEHEKDEDGFGGDFG